MYSSCHLFWWYSFSSERLALAIGRLPSARTTKTIVTKKSPLRLRPPKSVRRPLTLKFLLKNKNNRSAPTLVRLNLARLPFSTLKHGVRMLSKVRTVAASQSRHISIQNSCQMLAITTRPTRYAPSWSANHTTKF